MDDLLEVVELDGREIYPVQDDPRPRRYGRTTTTTTTPGEPPEPGPGPAPILVILLIVIWLWVPFVASVVFLVVILAIFATVDNPADLQSLQGATFSGITTASESLGLRNLQALLGKTAALLGTSNAVKFWNQLLESTPALQGLARDGLAVAVSQVDWVENGDAHVFKADMPGIRKEDVKVELEGDSILQISGQRGKEGADGAIVELPETWHRVERSQGRFFRRFQLPTNTKVDEVQAKVEDGVLTVTVPKIKRNTGLTRAVAIQ